MRNSAFKTLRTFAWRPAVLFGVLICLVPLSRPSSSAEKKEAPSAAAQTSPAHAQAPAANKASQKPAAAGEMPDDSGKKQVAVYALSRGKGVPEAAWAALGEARKFFVSQLREGKVSRIEEARIGLEGETRLCAKFTSVENARSAFERVGALTKGVDLVNLMVGPCVQKKEL